MTSTDLSPITEAWLDSNAGGRIQGSIAACPKTQAQWEEYDGRDHESLTIRGLVMTCQLTP